MAFGGVWWDLVGFGVGMTGQTSASLDLWFISPKKAGKTHREGFPGNVSIRISTGSCRFIESSSSSQRLREQSLGLMESPGAALLRFWRVGIGGNLEFY